MKVIRNAQGFAVAFGPDGDSYAPNVPDGCTLSVEENPDLTAPPASAIDQIRAIEKTPAVADAMQRAARLVALSYGLDDLIRIAASKGQTVTRSQAHDWAMVNDGNYRTLYEAEQAIKPLRVLV